MKLLLITLLLLLSILSTTKAQYSETLVTDRPGLTFSPNTLGKKVLQVQTGLNTTNNNQTSPDLEVQSFLSTSFLRYGLSDKFDIEAMIDFRNDQININNQQVDSLDLSGVSNTQLGFRYNYTQNDGWVPAIGFQGRLMLRAVSKDYERPNVGMVFNIMTSNQINNWLSFNMNIGAVLPRRNEVDYSLPSTFNFGISISEKWGTFIELFGNLNDFEPGFDTGLSYYVNNNLMLDLGGGYTPTDNIDTWFAEIGLSYRYSWRKN
ncbi:transporter [Flammeovirga yaeyamensis]|uniref:Transporter n=1 Tax=Flammeovirga yaeyamensis TaxID=367791 RepID=A0AAX1N6G6_9BACT|nr:transporter [Flammeovirga yaeyamensis]MBB3697662.1 hypothetical protein [Flammeovirga yaeyamensis]NMF35978.1 transporter [Flammeovirga yaeyamensis]QWG03075.1 transporter [Flammeovirga yaeyamensis]